MATDTQSLLGASNYAATKQNVSMARKWVRRAVAVFVNDETLYNLSLCADEIVDNARKHGRADGVISVALYLSDEAVRLEVINEVVGASEPHVTENHVTEEGHGMMIVDALARCWGEAKTDDHDQLVWCEFPRK